MNPEKDQDAAPDSVLHQLLMKHVYHLHIPEKIIRIIQVYYDSLRWGLELEISSNWKLQFLPGAQWLSYLLF